MLNNYKLKEYKNKTNQLTKNLKYIPKPHKFKLCKSKLMTSIKSLMLSNLGLLNTQLKFLETRMSIIKTRADSMF